jgi:ankyrin repeat protein
MTRDLAAQIQREQLHRAAESGNLARVQELLARKYPVNRFDDLGKTPLHYAVKEGHLDVVDCLIRAGANVNAQDKRMIGDTPLAEYAQECAYEIAKRLIDAGADPTIPGWMQLNAIHRAARRKDAAAHKIQQLLKKAADRRDR